MKKIEKQWLPHLEGSIPREAWGYSVSMYSIALEGWRRGLTLKFINKNRRKSEIYYSLKYKGREHLFTVSRGDKVSDEAVEICRNKHLTKEYLRKAGVPTPEGELFQKGVPDEEVIHYAGRLGYPLVIKPVDGTGGTGVIANIKNEEQFREALSYVRYDLKRPDVIVEKFFEGEDYRVYVIDGEAIGAIARIPANIIGDGKKTIKELLKLKSEERDQNPALFRRPIKFDKEMHNMLRLKGYTLDSIPKRGERVYLKSKNNVSAGGDPIDVTDGLTDEIKEIAIQAGKAIPGLKHFGVDLIVGDKMDTGVVLEINSMPSIRSHIFPMEGRARDIPKAIIDYYFPETKQNHDLSKPQYYFDIKSVFEAFQSGIAKEFIVPDVPKGDLSVARFIVTGTIYGVNYDRWVRRQARDLKLNGYIKYLDSETASIVVSGPTKSVNKFREIIHHQSSKKAKVTKVVERSRKSPVKVGFEIIDSNVAEDLKDGYFPVRLKGIPRKSKKTTNRITTLQKERDFYKRKYKAMKRSRSWRLTKPIRKIGDLSKRILN